MCCLVEDKEREQKWKIEDAIRTLKRAKEIEADEELMKAVAKELDNEKETLESISESVKKLYK